MRLGFLYTITITQFAQGSQEFEIIKFQCHNQVISTWYGNQTDQICEIMQPVTTLLSVQTHNNQHL